MFYPIPVKPKGLHCCFLLSSSQVRIICSAAAPLQSLFQVKQDSAELQENRVLMDDLDLSQDSAKGLSVFTGEEEVFAFQRTLSRLTEMQTEQYWNDGDRSKKTIKSWMKSPRRKIGKASEKHWKAFLAQLE